MFWGESPRPFLAGSRANCHESSGYATEMKMPSICGCFDGHVEVPEYKDKKNLINPTILHDVFSGWLVGAMKEERYAK